MCHQSAVLSDSGTWRHLAEHLCSAMFVCSVLGVNPGVILILVPQYHYQYHNLYIYCCSFCCQGKGDNLEMKRISSFWWRRNMQHSIFISLRQDVCGVRQTGWIFNGHISLCSRSSVKVESLPVRFLPSPPCPHSGCPFPTVSFGLPPSFPPGLALPASFGEIPLVSLSW